MSAGAFLDALRTEVDAARDAAIRQEARTLASFKHGWCPTEEQIQAEMPAARALVEIGANGCGEVGPSVRQSVRESEGVDRVKRFAHRLWWLLTGDCRHACSFDDLYGCVVPEAGCPVHDRRLFR